MKLQVLQENLNKAINLASRFTSNRTQLPILGNILLKIKGNKLNISSTNLEISVSISIGSKIDKEGEISIPSKVFTELIANLPKETLTLEAEKEQLKISTPNFSSNVLGMNTSDFPKIPAMVHKEKGVTLPKDGFSKALSKVLFASSIDETRPTLTGVLFVLDKGTLSLVATDGFRLSLVNLKSPVSNLAPKAVTLSRFILPKGILSEVGRIEADENIYLELVEKEKQAVFEIGDTILSSRLLEGEFPDYEKIIPKTSTCKILVDKEDLLRAVKLSAPFARDNANILKLRIKNEELIISAESSQVGNQEMKMDARVEISGAWPTSSVEKSGGFEIAFNYKFLEDFLGSVDGDEVKIEFSEVDKLGVFTDPTDPNYLHLIMPVKIQN